MTSPFADVFSDQETESPFASSLEQEPEQERSPFAADFDEGPEPEKPPEEKGFFANFLDKFKPKPFKGKIEFITDQELIDLEDPNIPYTEKVDLIKKLNTQREFEQGIAASRGLLPGIGKALEPDIEFKTLDETNQNVFEGMGHLISFMAAAGPVTKGTQLILPRAAPWITRMIGAGTTEGLLEFSSEFFDPDKEVDPIKIATEAGKMALLDGSFQAIGGAFNFFRDVNRIAKVFDVSNSKAFRFVWDQAGKRGVGVKGFAEDARKWADLADDLAKSAEEGRITLEVPDAEIGGKPIAELEGPTIETSPIEARIEDIDPSLPTAENIRDIEGKLARTDQILDSLESGKPTSEVPIPEISSLEMGTPAIKSPTEMLSEGTQPSGVSTSALSPPSGVDTTLTTSRSSVLTGPTTTLGIQHPLNSKLIVRQGYPEVKKILQQASDYKPLFDEYLNKLKETIPGINKVKSRVKDLAGALQKAEFKGGLPETLGDYLGGRVIVDDMHAVQKIIDSIESNFRVLESDNFLEGRPDGYRAIHYQLDTGQGLSVELQVMPREIAEVFPVNHKLYDKWKREKFPLDPEKVAERRKDYKQMEENFKTAWGKFMERQKPLVIKPSPQEVAKQKAFQQWRKRQLEKQFTKLKIEEVNQDGMEGFSEEFAEEIADPDPTDFSPEDEAILKNAEVDGNTQNGLLKPDAAEALNSTWNKLGFNVERPFQQSGAPETGFRIKNYYSEMARKEEQTIEAIKKIGNFNKAQRSELALLAEKAEPPKDPKLAEAYHEIRKFFDDTFQELKKADVLTNPFPETYIKRLEDENAALEELFKTTKDQGKKSELLRQVLSNNQLISDLRQTKFVSIPARLWFEQNFDLNKPVSERTVRLLNQKKRVTPTIASMIENEIIAPEDVDIAEIMAYYGRRAARDIGLGKILKAAAEEGLASKVPRQGFVQLPVYQYPAIKDYHIHPVFADWLTSYTRPYHVGMFGRLSSKVKSYAFYNPVILPFNDLVQQIMATQGAGVKYWGQAIKDVVKKTPTFWEAHENGLFSQPYNMFEDDFKRQWTNALTENKSLPQRFKRFLVNDKIVNGVFRASSHVAWSADRMLRMATYRNFLARGMSPREAAQTAALFHGDYAMVNPNTRKVANQFFFTPTFKVVMGKLYSEMLKSPVKIGRAMLNGKAPDKVDKAKFWGLVGTLGIIIGLDQYMTNGIGFQRDHWGRKYSKRKVDDEGVEKDLVVNFSNPANLPLKFFWRAVESFSPSNKSVFKEFLNKNRFELNPVINTVAKLVNNTNDNGDPIYQNYGDDSLTKLAKASDFVISDFFPLIKKFADEPFEDPEARQKFFEEVGVVLDSLPGSFTYWGPDKEEVRVRKIQQANTEFMREMKRRAEKGLSITDDMLQKHQKLLEKLAEE